MSVGVSGPRVGAGMRRSAEPRFGHPFAAVAVVTAEHWPAVNARAEASPWHGLPIFSAWISNPAGAAEDDSRLG